MKGDDICERLIDYSSRIISVVQALPGTVAGRHVSRQLLRCGTSAGANYEEARGAESRADFIHKVGVAWKEIRESIYWLKVIGRSKLLPPSRLESILDESDQLCKILFKSRSTARGNTNDPNPDESCGNQDKPEAEDP